MLISMNYSRARGLGCRCWCCSLSTINNNIFKYKKKTKLLSYKTHARDEAINVTHSTQDAKRDLFTLRLRCAQLQTDCSMFIGGMARRSG